MADKIISSSAGEFTINAMEKDRPYFIDLYNFDFYFMNHGVNCGDCSNWLNKFNKNIHIFFNTGVKERQAIIDGRSTTALSMTNACFQKCAKKATRVFSACILSL